MESYFRSYVETLKMELDRINYYDVEQIINVILDARKRDQQIFIIGNGGSAATASHLTCDLSKGTINHNDHNFKRFRTISLTDNMAIFTAIANDISYDDAFVEQLKNFLNPGDIVLAITASGNSPNIIKSLKFAKEVHATTIGLLGFGGGQAGKLVDYQLTIHSRNYGIAEDFHLISGHILSQMIRIILQKDSKKVLFLDRDGVINHTAPEHDYIKSWEEFQFYPEIFEGLHLLQEMGFRFVIITNQRGIARGLFTEAQLQEIHSRMLSELRLRNISIDKIYYCPHDYEDHCGCRKPDVGMFHRAQSELPYLIDLNRSFVVGDSDSDIKAGNRLNVKTVFIENGFYQKPEIEPTISVRNLLDFAKLLRKETIPGHIPVTEKVLD